MKLIIIGGLSGSGKTVALRAIEDMGFYCVDNLPVVLLPNLINTLASKKSSIAVSIDVRNIPKSISIFEKIVNNLPSFLLSQLLFIHADNNTLIRRYSETRRVHPLSIRYISLECAIREEKLLLEPFRSRSNLEIDTSNMSIHELASTLRIRLLGNNRRELMIVFKSFSYKQGIPLDVDYVFDVRFLPNPYKDGRLRTLSGLDPLVGEFLNQHIEVKNFIYKTCDYLSVWLPLLETSNRAYLTIGVGCTGGRHRSVYITEQLANYFRSQGRNVWSFHQMLASKDVY